MIFTEISQKEFEKFVSKSSQNNYVQSLDEGKLKSAQGFNVYYVGVKEDNILAAATMMYSLKSKKSRVLFYAPRGYIMNFENIELLDYFTRNIKKYIKNHNGYALRIDPKVIYLLRDSNGKPISEPNANIINNLKKCGYKHFGFNKEFETVQIRYQAVLNLKSTYEEQLQSFTKTTRKHIESLKNSAIKVRKGNKNDISLMQSLFQVSADNKHFDIKDVKSYELMYDYLSKYMNIYIASINFEEEYNLLMNQKAKLENEKNELLKQMSKINVGAKMNMKLEKINNNIENNKNSIIRNEENHKKYGKSVDISALLSIESGNEYISLTSGMLSEFKDYNPKYAMYNEHIKDAFNKGLKRVNFYGIAGYFDNSNDLYKIYEIKKGFNPIIEELIGEFTLPVTIEYYLHKIKKVFK